MEAEERPLRFRRVTVFAPDRERPQRARERLERMLAAAGFEVGENPGSAADLVVSLGGDGTFLQAVRRFLDTGAAFLGVNAGHLGFLQEAEEDQLVAVVDRLSRSRFRVAEERLLEVTVLARRAGAEPQAVHVARALNDALVERRGTRALRLTVRVDGHDLGPLVADGVLVASPLGSTGYAYAAGGPLVHPEAPVLQLLALNPHRSALARGLAAPLVLPDRATVEIDVDWGRERTPRLVVDGEEVPLGPEQSVRVRRGEEVLRLVRLDLLDFWQRVRIKLG